MLNHTMKFLKILAAVLAFANIAVAAKPVVMNAQLGEEIRHLDPQLATGIGSAHININLFSGLYEYDGQTGEPKQDLVVSHTKNEDSTVWTFKLRSDVHWVKLEGGEVKKLRPVTAHDVVFSYRRILAPKTASEYAYMLYILKNAEGYNKGKITDATQLGVKAIDDTTVELTMAGSVPTLIQYLPHHSFHIVPKEPIEKHGEKWIEAGNMWNSGHYIFKEWKLKDSISILRNPHHPEAEQAQVDAVKFKFIGTSTPEAVRAFRAGETDIDYVNPPTSDIASLKKAKNLMVARQLGTYFLRLNITKPPLNDVRVRQALALTIPRGQIVKRVTKGGQIPMYSFVPRGMEGYVPVPLTTEKSYKKRVEQAKKLMAEAGYPNGEGFPELNYLYNTSESHQKVAVVVAKAWNKALGIKSKPMNQEWKVYLSTISNKDFQVARAGWVADMADPMNFLEMFITDGGNNSTGFSNKTYDELISKARIEGDLKTRNQLMKQAETILMAELPIIPIYNYTTMRIKQDYVSGFFANKLGQHPIKNIKIDVNKRQAMFPEKEFVVK